MMTVCVKCFKTAVLIVTLVNFGIGYTKFYLLLSDLFDDLKNVDISSNLAWIPNLIVQVCSTVFFFVQVFCLLRELCEENYMYRHCFKFCYVITILIYCLSVVPKSIINVIYHSYDVTSSSWWIIVTDAFDSILSMLSALGFQVVMFLVIIRKTCVSAGACKDARIYPIKDARANDVIDDVDGDQSSACCFRRSSKKEGLLTMVLVVVALVNGWVLIELVIRNQYMKLDEYEQKRCICILHHDISADEIEATDVASEDTEEATVARTVKETKAVVANRGKTTLKRLKKLDDDANNRFEDTSERMKSKVNRGIDATTSEVKQKLGNKHILTVSEYVEEKRDKLVTKKQQLGEKVCDVAEAAPGGRNCCRCVRAGKGLLCSSVEDRTTCFIVSMSLASIDFMVFLVEMVMIMCFVC